MQDNTHRPKDKEILVMYTSFASSVFVVSIRLGDSAKAKIAIIFCLRATHDLRCLTIVFNTNSWIPGRRPRTEVRAEVTSRS